MYCPERVSGAQRVRGLHQDPSRLFGRKPPASLESCPEGLAIHVRHHEVDESLWTLADAVDGDDVRVRQPSGGLRLPQETDADLLAEGEIRWEHLHRDLPLESLVARVINDA